MEEEFNKGRKKATLLLNQKDRTVWELQDRLTRAGFEEAVVEDAIAYVTSFHYLDDKRYAMQYADIHRERKSIRRIRQELKQKHVPEEYIELALEEIAYDDSQALHKALTKCLKGREISELSYEDKEKIAAKLYRKGFRTSDIFQSLT